MAVRGIVTCIRFFDANYVPGDAELYAYQNHFPETKTINSDDYEYNSFQITPIVAERDNNPPRVTVDFVATAENVDLVEEAIANKYVMIALLFRWGSVEGIDDPTTFNLFHAYVGDCLGGSSDFSTVQLEVGRYNGTGNTDLPWRKIPWTILGPLSFRR